MPVAAQVMACAVRSPIGGNRQVKPSVIDHSPVMGALQARFVAALKWLNFAGECAPRGVRDMHQSPDIAKSNNCVAALSQVF